MRLLTPGQSQRRRPRYADLAVHHISRFKRVGTVRPLNTGAARGGQTTEAAPLKQRDLMEALGCSPLVIT